MKTHPLLDTASIDPAAFTIHAGVFLASGTSEEHDEALAAALGDLGGDEWVQAHDRAGVLAELGDAVIDSRFRQKGTCDHCGAWFKFGIVYKHTSGALVVVGNTCAAKSLSVSDRYTLVLNRAKKAAEAAAKSAKNKAAALAQAEAGGFGWLYSETHTHRILADIADKGRQWGSLSVAQVALIERIRSGEKPQWMIEKEAREAARAAEVKIPVIEGRIVVTGTVRAIKYAEGYGFNAPEVKKLIIADERGFVVWVTCPDSIYTCKQGDRVSLKATVTKGDRDPTFGFAKRPTNAAILSAAAGG